jgi:hypothetical protein
MNAYRIENTTSGIVLGVYQADTEAEALDAMARDAGYTSTAAMIAAVGPDNDLLVTEVR